MKKILMIVAAVFAMHPAHAGYFYTGNDLVKLSYQFQKARRSDRDTDYSDAWAFRGFVAGVHDSTADAKVYCEPRTAQDSQIAAVVAIYLDRNPSKLNRSAADLVVDALKDAYPCR